VSRIDTRLAPHSLEAERALLGVVLVRASAWSEIASLVSGDEFYRDAHRRIFAAMSELSSESVAIDLVTLNDRLRRTGDLETCGGPAYVASLIDGIPKSANVSYYADIVREKSQLRRLIEVNNETMAMAFEESMPTDRLVDRLGFRLSEVVRAGPVGLVSSKEALENYGASLVSGELAQPIKTSYADLDSLVGGFRPGEVTMVAARPSVGKTSFLLGSMEAMAARGESGLLFSLEMSARALAARQLSWRSGVSVVDVDRGTASEDDYGRIGQALLDVPSVPLLFQTTAKTMSAIRAWSQRVKDERELHVIGIDYIQIVATEKEYSESRSRIAAVSMALKSLARDLDVCVVALSQLSRAPEGRSDKRPHMSDMSGSGSLEQDADLLILLHRQAMHDPKPENEFVAEAIVAKNKSGPTGVVKLSFVPRLARFGNLDYREA